MRAYYNTSATPVNKKSGFFVCYNDSGNRREVLSELFVESGKSGVTFFDCEGAFSGNIDDAESFTIVRVRANAGRQRRAAGYHGLPYLLLPVIGQGSGVGRHPPKVRFNVQGYYVCIKITDYFLAEGFDGDLPGFERGIGWKLQVHHNDELAVVCVLEYEAVYTETVRESQAADDEFRRLGEGFGRLHVYQGLSAIEN